MSDFRTIVVAYDFSEHARRALYVAADLAKRLDARLHLLHVIQPPSFAYGLEPFGQASMVPVADMKRVRDEALEALQQVAADVDAAPRGVEADVVEATAIADAISGFAAELEADLIVMGTHGRSGLEHVFLGSVAERTLRRAPCPVLGVPVVDEDAAQEGD